jgi:hypothetical protein
LQFVDVACHLLLASSELGGDRVDALPDVSETERYRFELLLIGRKGGRGLGNRSGRRRQGNRVKKSVTKG